MKPTEDNHEPPQSSSFSHESGQSKLVKRRRSNLIVCGFGWGALYGLVSGITTGILLIGAVAVGLVVSYFDPNGFVGVSAILGFLLACTVGPIFGGFVGLLLGAFRRQNLGSMVCATAFPIISLLTFTSLLTIEFGDLNEIDLQFLAVTSLVILLSLVPVGYQAGKYLATRFNEPTSMLLTSSDSQ